MKSNNCPCCSQSMLLHLSGRRSYWFCNHCRLEMPDVKASKQKRMKLDSASLGATAPLRSERSVVTVS